MVSLWSWDHLVSLPLRMKSTANFYQWRASTSSLLDPGRGKEQEQLYLTWRLTAVKLKDSSDLFHTTENKTGNWGKTKWTKQWNQEGRRMPYSVRGSRPLARIHESCSVKRRFSPAAYLTQVPLTRKLPRHCPCARQHHSYRTAHPMMSTHW